MLLLTTVAVALLTGCERTCEEARNEAFDVVLASLDDPSTCTSDDDCTTVAIGGTCFAGCSAVIHVDDVARFDEATERANREICPVVGCSPVIPPCVPPLPVGCVEGTCRERIPTEE